jgi:WD40 repeat protein
MSEIPYYQQSEDDQLTVIHISPKAEQALQRLTSELEGHQEELVDSFNISAEVEDALQELSLLLDIYEGTFTMLLVRCNYQKLRDRAIEHLHQISSTPLRQVHLQPQTLSIYQAIQTEIGTQESHQQPVMVMGIENSLHIDTLVKGLNQIREEFRKNCHFPIVLWINDKVMKYLIKSAPDFESWTTTIAFTVRSNELIGSLRAGSEALFKLALTANLIDPSFSLGRISHLGGIYLSELDVALRDLQMQGKAIAPSLQAGLDFIRGMNTNSFAESLAYLQSSYKYWELEQDFERQGLLLYQIARRRYHLTKLEKHSHTENWQVVQDLFARSIACFEIADRYDLVAECYLQVQRTLYHLQAWSELRDISHRAIPLHQQYDNPAYLAADYGFLAAVSLEQHCWEEAQDQAQKALELLSESPDTVHWLYGLYWCYLAEALVQLGETDAALNYLLQAKKRDHCGHPHMYIRILNELRNLYFSQGRYWEAFQIKQERLAIEQRYGYRAFMGAGQLQSCLEEQSSFTVKPNQFIISPEIYASGRKTDLDEMTKRISEPRYKMIVLHGNSGVGKSSFINAGLMPALQQNSFGGRTVMPISMRVYNSWEQELTGLIVNALGVLQITTAPLLAHPIAAPIRNNNYLQNLPNSQAQFTATELDQAEYSQEERQAMRDRLIEQLRWNEAHNLRSVLVFDQFEEFFFVHQNQIEERIQFFEFIGGLLNDFQNLSSLKIVLSLREDYIHYLLEGNRIQSMEAIDNDILSKNILYQLGNFSTAAARSTISTLTERAQFYLEPQLIDILVNDLKNAQNEVRPIELQIVGAQMQHDQISTIQQYRKLGDHPTEKLVQRYLDNVVQDCGTENYRLTNLILYLLTDEKGTRPLKTYNDLKRELHILEQEFRQQTTNEVQTEPDSEIDINKIELILQILIGSGLVVLIPEASINRCQLVHDYLAVVIRKTQSPELQKLQKELEKTQGELRQTVRQLENSLTNSQAIADSLALHSLLTNNLLDLDELNNALTLAQRWLSEIDLIASENRWLFTSTIHRAIYEIKEMNRISAHLEGVWSAAFNREGTLLITGGLDKLIRVWEANGNQIMELAGHTAPVRTAVFSADSNLILSCSSDKTISLWNRRGDRLLTMTGHTGAVWSACFSPDEQIIASASADKTMKLWRRDGSEICTLQGHRGDVRAVLFSPDGQWLISGGADKNILIWSVDGRLLKTVKGHTADIRCLDISPNGALLISGSGDNILKLWQIDWELVRSSLVNGTGETGDELVPDRAIAEVFSIEAHTSAIRSLSFSPDGSTIATGSADKNIRLWDLLGRELKTFKGHDEAVRAISFSPDGKLLLSGGLDSTARIWHIQHRMQRLFYGHNAAVRTISFSPDGNHIASGGLDNKMNIWDLQGNILQSIELEYNVMSLCYSPDGKYMAIGSGDSAIALWSVAKTPQLVRNFTGHSTAIWSVDISPDGQHLISGSGDKLAKVWRIDGTELATLRGHRSTIWTVKFSPDGQHLISGSGDDTVKLWNLQGQELHTLRGHRGAVWSVCFSPDGQLILSGSSDGTLKLWNLQGELLNTFRGHESVIWAVSFSHDGRNIISASSDNTIRLWNLNGKEMQTLSCPDHTPITLSCHPQGKSFVSGHGSNAIGLWNFDLSYLIQQGKSWLQHYA